jgi:glycosyltransferase involved in cell wall biosynthesis
MIVALDMQLSLGTATGIGEYVRGLADALRARGVALVELQEPKLDPWRFDRRVVWDQVVLPQRARASGADVLHCASGTMPLRVSLPTVVTVHDVAWLKVQRHTRPYARYYFGTFALQRYRAAGAIAVDSEFSRQELLDVLNFPPERVHVVYPGVANDFCALQRRASGERLILVPGTVERRKNIEVLIRALPEMPAARIVSVGPSTPYREECENLARDLGVQDRLEFRGYVKRSELLELYATCALVAVPSRYEGFGYAAAQALCAGAPVVVSDKSSLPEVVKDAAPIATADDEREWVRELVAIFSDPQSAQARADAQRASAIARFSWDSSAAAMQRVYESIRSNAR